MTPKKKSVWVLAMAGVSYNDDFYRPSPVVEVQAVGTYENCIKALKRFIRKEASAFWEGTSNFEECVKSELEEVMASRKDYGPSTKEWELNRSSLKLVWRLQRKTQK